MNKKPVWQRPQYVFRAIAEDITMAAGGPMGSPTELMWERFFNEIGKAKAYCIKVHGEPFKWSGRGQNVSSPDLGHVQYTISKVRVL